MMGARWSEQQEEAMAGSMQPNRSITNYRIILRI